MFPPLPTDSLEQRIVDGFAECIDPAPVAARGLGATRVTDCLWGALDGVNDAGLAVSLLVATMEDSAAQQQPRDTP